jgi:hypothetical protein
MALGVAARTLVRDPAGTLSRPLERGRRTPGEGIGGNVRQQPSQYDRSDKEEAVHVAEPAQRRVADDRVLVPSQWSR